MNFEELAKFPMREDEWLVTVAIGGVLVAFGWLFVPALLVWGYVFEVVRGAVAGEEHPPSFDDWGSLLGDGVTAFVVLLAYQILPAVVAIGVVLLFVILGAGTDSAGVGFLGFFLGALTWAVLGTVFAYFGFAAVTHAAVEDSLGAGFQVGTVVSLATTGAWLKAYAFYLVFSMVASLVGALGGGIGAPVGSFYALSAGGRAFGEAYATAMGSPAATGEAAAATA